MPAIDLKDPLAPKDVCRILLKRRLISKEQARTLLQRYPQVEEELNRENRKRMASFGLKVSNPITFVDVAAHIGPLRSDGKPGSLEEDVIYKALAAEWEIPYKKIDPLKLDLNVVTTTIPRSFAMKHLVLPIDVSKGTLTVATPNPHNMEVMDDIARVANMRVAAVVASKTCFEISIKLELWL